MYVKAYAKINIYLDVLSKREDGYHDLDMVMLPLELHDSIDFEYVPFLQDCYITCDHVELKETKYNSINLTIKEMRNKYNFKENYSVLVHKEIPICAGMGGGSSNAAATIKGLSSLLKIKMKPEEELEIATKIGADVPYCLINKPAHVEGIGEKVTVIKMKKQYHVIVIKPTLGLSTQKVFLESDKEKYEHGNINNVITALENGDDDLLSTSMFNALEKTSIRLVPEIQEIKDMFKNDGFKMVLMTGSGSCVFALTDNFKKAFTSYHKYDKKGYEVYLTKTLKTK